MSLWKKMVKVMEEVGQLEKDGSIKDRSGKLMYSFLSEEQTTAALQKAFIKYGIVMLPVEVTDDLFYIEGERYEKPFKNAITKVNVKYKIVDSDTGEHDFICSIGYGSDDSDKGSNKAMTGAFKYAQRQAFMISTGDDGDHMTPDSPSPSPAAPKKTAPLVDKLTAEQEKRATETANELKKVWQEIYGDLNSFDKSRKDHNDKGISDQEFLSKLNKKLSEKSSQPGGTN